MRPRLLALVTMLFVAGGVLQAPGAHAAVGAQLFAGGLAFPAAFTFAPDGRVFYGERFSGDIRILSADGSTDDFFFTVPNLSTNGEQGLLGLALHPDYPATPSVYAYATRNISGTLRNQIVRITDNAGAGENMLVVFSSSTVAGDYHDGGRIEFGPDGMLYAMVGEGHSQRNAQRLGNTAGKILRMTPSGNVPNNNPLGDRLIYSYGHRNSYGFDFDPVTGRLWEDENGPECNDEINRIIPGRNYGWGRHETCSHPPKSPRNTNQDGPNPVMPRRYYSSPIAPTGLAFCDGCGLAGGDGRFFFGAWNTGDIRRMTLDGDRKNITKQTVVYGHNQGILSMETAPDGALFFSDPNGIFELVAV